MTKFRLTKYEKAKRQIKHHHNLSDGCQAVKYIIDNNIPDDATIQIYHEQSYLGDYCDLSISLVWYREEADDEYEQRIRDLKEKYRKQEEYKEKQKEKTQVKAEKRAEKVRQKELEELKRLQEKYKDVK